MIARHVIARLLETFFSRWWLYILPVVALTGLGFYTAGSKADEYRSSAVLSADLEPLLGDFQDVARVDVLSWENAAQSASRRINEALRTDEFVRVVAAGAGVPADSTVVTLLDVRGSLWVSADGQNLLSVNARTIDPQLAQRLVQSTITTFLQTVVDDQISTGTATVEYLMDQQDQLQGDYDKATDASANSCWRIRSLAMVSDRSRRNSRSVGSTATLNAWTPGWPTRSMTSAPPNS